MRCSRGGCRSECASLSRWVGWLGVWFGRWLFLGFLFLWVLTRFFRWLGRWIRLWHDGGHGRGRVCGCTLWRLGCCPLGLLLGGFLCLLTGLCGRVLFRGLFFLCFAFRRRSGVVDYGLIFVVCVITEDSFFIPLRSFLRDKSFDQRRCFGFRRGLGGSD